MIELELTEAEQGMLSGADGPAVQMAMRILVTMARVYGAPRLLTISSAHIDGCLYHGQSGLDFAERLVAGGAQVRVPTTLNVGAVDLLHPEHFQGSATQAQAAARLMALYQQMGCEPLWTCAPYQAGQRPGFGEQIAWAESNAIVFANSVLGARTQRYGDFIDICAAITGRAPAIGLHLAENRRGQQVFDLTRLPLALLAEDAFFPVLGYYLGQRSAEQIPVLLGLPAGTSEDQLKALGAAAASSGAIALFHAVGLTPEAPTLAAALGDQPAEDVIVVSLDDLRATRQELSTVPDGPIGVVALGSPHFSLAEFGALLPLLDEYAVHPDVEFIVCTNRFVLVQLARNGWRERLQAHNVRLVVDTCVVVTPIVRSQDRVLMTNSGKFAHYTPGNIGLQVIFGSLRECVRSAAQGFVWRDDSLWGMV